MRRSRRGNARLPRRNLIAGAGSVVATALIGLGRGRAEEATPVTSGMAQGVATPPSNNGRLLARPAPPTESVAPGLHRLGLTPDRDAVLYVPDGYQPEEPTPFVLSLHGAGGNAAAGLYPLGELADEHGLLILAPASRQQTWDLILGGFGPDITFIEQALAAAFSRCAVDPNRLAVAGFSDGASYAVTLGVTNGDLFPQVMAFSPGLIGPKELHGDPRLFISHGTRDQVLPINLTSRPMVRLLARAGYDVVFLEYDSGHTVPPEVAREAVDWFLDP